MTDTVLVEQVAGVLIVTLNRPARLNSFNPVMHGELADALAHAAEDDRVRAVLLTGTGRGFCAGQDLSDRTMAAQDDRPVDLGTSLDSFYNPLIRTVAGLPKPVVCAVNGIAAGGGANLALGCDIVVAARSARFVQAFARIGLCPDSGGTWLLPRLLGQARALGLVLTGDAIDAADAAAWGLIWRCVDDDRLMAEAMGMAVQLAAGPPRALAAAKRLIRDAWNHPLDAALERERDEIRALGASGDYREGVAAFLAKRAPVFTGE